MSDYWYLASPYSLYEAGLGAAAEEASRAAGLLIKAGIPVFAPIPHSHAIAMAAGIEPRDFDLWIEADRPLMEAAKGLIVLELEGWEESRGVFAEVAAFKAMSKPIAYMVPGEVPELVRHL